MSYFDIKNEQKSIIATEQRRELGQFIEEDDMRRSSQTFMTLTAASPNATAATGLRSRPPVLPYLPPWPKKQKLPSQLHAASQPIQGVPDASKYLRESTTEPEVSGHGASGTDA